MAANSVRIVCPSCKFTKEVPDSAVPPGRRTIGCPQCKKKFEFEKPPAPSPSAPGTGAAAAPRKPAAPPAPAPDLAAAGGPDPVPVAAPRKRNLRLFAGLLGALVFAGSLLGGAAYLFHWQPIVAEKFWIAGLLTGIEPVQRASIHYLREYPTRNAVVALVAFINLKNLHRVPDPKQAESDEDRRKRLAKRASDLKLADRAAERLCMLTGESFGTHFRKERIGYSWGKLDERDWPRVLGQINLWALRTFANAGIPAPSGGTPGAGALK